MEHSKLSPSAASRWVLCPSSIYRCKDYPEQTSEFAEEGRLAHEVAEKALRSGNAPTCENHEMENYVGNYVKTIRKAAKDADFVWYEEKLDLSEVLGVPEQFGTDDVIILKHQALEVHDLKYGKGVRVSAEENLQMICYALGALKIAELVAEIKVVKMCIHQIRLEDGYSEWQCTVEELLKFGEFLSGRAAIAATIDESNVDKFYCPGDKQCRFCPAKGECKALSDYNMNIVGDDFENIEEVAEYDGERIAALLPKLDLIIKWANAVQEAALNRAISGKVIPGYKLVNGRGGSRKWADEAEAENVMKSMRLKIDEMYTKKLATPPVIEKLLKKKNPLKWERLAGMITRSDPAPALVEESDPREAISINTGDDFTDLTKNLGEEFL